MLKKQHLSLALAIPAVVGRQIAVRANTGTNKIESHAHKIVKTQVYYLREKLKQMKMLQFLACLEIHSQYPGAAISKRVRENEKGLKKYRPAVA